MQKKTIMVAAIDFGTTFSGWAYSFKYEFESDPCNIHAKNWNNGTNISSKTPTTVLIEPDGKTFVAFGYEAEDKYASLCTEGKQKDFYYFSRFKMMLHNKLVRKLHFHIFSGSVQQFGRH